MEDPVIDVQKADQELLVPVEEEPDLCFQNDTFRDRWIVIRKLSAGCFGQIYMVKDPQMNMIQALKVESSKNEDRVTLPLELQVLKSFQGKSAHVTELYGAGTERQINFIAMQLLGRNLASFRNACPHEPKRFSLNTAMRLSKQCLEAIRDLHSICYLHRDVKPANFAMGKEPFSNKNTVYILDFGMSRCYTDERGIIRPARKVVGFRGTVRYCSINAHYRKKSLVHAQNLNSKEELERVCTNHDRALRKLLYYQKVVGCALGCLWNDSTRQRDLGRRDDLISLFYMITEFLTGSLPWKNSPSAKEVLESKEQNLLPNLVSGLPKLDSFGRHVLSLNFADRPSYSLLIDCVDQIMNEKKIYSTDSWDWENDYKYPMFDENDTTEQSISQSISTNDQ